MTPSLEQMQAAFTQADYWYQEVHKQDALRATASQQFSQTFAQLKEMMQDAIDTLTFHYRHELGRVEQWGLDTAMRSWGISMRKPATQQEWFAFVEQYITKEESLLPADRIATPSLADIQALYTDMQAHRMARDKAFAARQIAVEKKREDLAELTDFLKTAAVVLVVIRFQRRVMQALEDWGYRVIISSRKGKKNQELLPG